MDDFESVLDVADSLMTVEDLSWASLFHDRYLCSGRLMKLSELDHIKAVTEVRNCSLKKSHFACSHRKTKNSV